MLRTIELLDLAKKRQGNVSDYRLARLLGVTQPTVTGYRQGRSRPAASTLARLAELCGIDPRAVLVWIEVERAERAKDPAAKELWLSIACQATREYLPPNWCEGCTEACAGRQNVAVDNSPAAAATPALARLAA